MHEAVLEQTSRVLESIRSSHAIAIPASCPFSASPLNAGSLSVLIAWLRLVQAASIIHFQPPARLIDETALSYSQSEAHFAHPSFALLIHAIGKARETLPLAVAATLPSCQRVLPLGSGLPQEQERTLARKNSTTSRSATEFPGSWSSSDDPSVVVKIWSQSRIFDDFPQSIKRVDLLGSGAVFE
eukprot:3298080-Pleurochrysis_carterae.AAC.9